HSLIRAFNPQPYPRWAYQDTGWTIEKTIRFASSVRNELVITYTLLGGEGGVELEVKPLFALRGIHELMYQWSGRLEAEVPAEPGDCIRIPATARTPEVYFCHDGTFDGSSSWYLSTIYRRERERGYAGLEDLWMPGTIHYRLEPGRPVHLAVSTERLDLARTLEQLEWQDRMRPSVPAVEDSDRRVQRLIAAAAEQFRVCTPSAGSGPWSSIVPQFPWTAWSVRDMLIALPGLLLCQGHHELARLLLTTLAGQIRQGLIPSELDEKGGEPAYNACDTSLWWINALWQYLAASNDEPTAGAMLPHVLQVIERYQGGTSLGIEIDGDGLLRVRAPGLGCTWMNAKVGDWVITPRHGRPVEVNALWYNALMIAAALSERLGETSRVAGLRSAAARQAEAFNQRFWNATSHCCFDVVWDNGEDSSIRPNQLLAVSLPFPVLAPVQWKALLQTVKERLLTPYGVRTLAPSDASYQGKYAGDVVSRDRAYHQGSAYPWLLGPYSTALSRAFGRSASVREEIRKVWRGCVEHLQAEGLGLLPELFDGDPPHRPGGAVADARSVGELARVWHEEILPTSSPLPNQDRTRQYTPAR
ncbi:MAG: amylo-alpha-1,6-glucosidase, partial [Phycisphaerae bacterium]|nr:amylo-alpha-1,6-glucosidase [Phycisphaerae bacterium]